jgi:SAM-dependent methyltransferase
MADIFLEISLVGGRQEVDLGAGETLASKRAFTNPVQDRSRPMTPNAALLPKTLANVGVPDPIAWVAGSLNPSARPGFRWQCGYAKAKVRVDPLYRTALPLIPPGTKVLDLGCGVGLLGLLLQARGLGNETHGIEWDPAKARFAQELAQGTPTIRIASGDFLQEPWPPCSVIAALDVLHYLTLEQQQSLIHRVVDHLPEGGRFILRAMDREAKGMAHLTRLGEKLAVLSGWNRALHIHWRPLEAICRDLESAGLSLFSPIGSRGLGMGNHLLVGVKRN